MKQRQYGIDLLKAVCMLMVICLHAAQYGLANAHTGYFVSECIALFFRSFSIVAVNCFVLIAGYFLSTSSFSIFRLFKLWTEVALFSAGLYLCAVVSGIDSFSIRMLLEACLPIMTNRYWFFTCYFFLCLLTPVLNYFINNASQKSYQKILLILLLIFSVIPSFGVFGDRSGAGQGFTVLWFAVLYIAAGYFRKYGVPSVKFGGGGTVF